MKSALQKISFIVLMVMLLPLVPSGHLHAMEISDSSMSNMEAGMCDSVNSTCADDTQTDCVEHCFDAFNSSKINLTVVQNEQNEFVLIDDSLLRGNPLEKSSSQKIKQRQHITPFPELRSVKKE
jgi:hypothetical protein